MDKESAIAALIEHYSFQDYHPEDYYSYVVNADGKYLGPYIPYVGKSYFKTKPRLLIYAMAQNLNRAEWLIRSWLNSPDKGLLRQYHDSASPRVHVYPYDTGHLKVIAALTLNYHPQTCYEPTSNVNDLVAITNFVKFSFYYKDKSSGKRLDANPPMDIYDVMWKHYCKHEISILRPDIIIGVGNDVTNAIKRNLKEEHEAKIILIKVPFPGRINLNARWIPKGKQLIKTENYDPAEHIAEIQALLKGTPDKKGLVRRAIETDWYYFLEAKACLTEKLARLA